MCAQSLSHVWLLPTPRTVAGQAPLSMGFSRQEHWGGLPFPSPGESSPHRDRTCISCGSCIGRRILHHWATWKALIVLESCDFSQLKNCGHGMLFWVPPFQWGRNSDTSLKSDIPYLLSSKHSKKQNIQTKFRWKIDFWYMHAVSIVISIISLLGGKINCKQNITKSHSSWPDAPGTCLLGSQAHPLCPGTWASTRKLQDTRSGWWVLISLFLCPDREVSPPEFLLAMVHLAEASSVCLGLLPVSPCPSMLSPYLGWNLSSSCPIKQVHTRTWAPPLSMLPTEIFPCPWNRSHQIYM